ncbi:MAG: MarR family winged helix-turn-helix transcriptional regulator [Acidobacteriia bacterium]|nr:MarR family winged helix-turn-helix transcriptional regulator [Terriglobia bacterium]
MYIHTMKQPGLKPQGGIVSLPCACANLRRAARIVTQRYDQELQPAGIKATQFTLLQALTRVGNISQGALGDLLGLDSTTLTRTLALLRSKGWIQTKPGKDRRQVRLTLTAEGRRKYLSAMHYWQSAQKQLRRVLGEAGWKQMMESTILTAALAQQQ